MCVFLILGMLRLKITDPPEGEAFGLGVLKLHVTVRYTL